MPTGESGPRYTEYYFHDLHKNVTEIVGNDGRPIAYYYYSDPYGNAKELLAYPPHAFDYPPYEINPNDNIALQPDNPFQYSSEYYDKDLALVQYHYRDYNPRMGRWLTPDPIEEEGGTNLYAFVSNDPVNYVDVKGNWGAGLNGKDGPRAKRGHSDFPGQGIFDYNKEDNDAYTSPFYPFAMERHFRSLEKSEEGLTRAVTSCNQANYERSAHQMQDFFSHRGQGFSTITGGHAGASILSEQMKFINGIRRANGLEERADVAEPDNAKDYESAYDQARERSQDWLNLWEKCCCLKADKKNWIRKNSSDPECNNPKGPDKVKAIRPQKSRNRLEYLINKFTQ